VVCSYISVPLTPLLPNNPSELCTSRICTLHANTLTPLSSESSSTSHCNCCYYCCVSCMHCDSTAAVCAHASAQPLRVVSHKSTVYSSSSSAPPAALEAARLRATRPGRPCASGESTVKSMCFSESTRTVKEGTFTSCLPTLMWRCLMRTRAWWMLFASPCLKTLVCRRLSSSFCVDSCSTKSSSFSSSVSRPKRVIRRSRAGPSNSLLGSFASSVSSWRAACSAVLHV
jgi:hypothetical protein